MYVLMHTRKRLLQTNSHLPPRMCQASPHPTTTSCPITDTHVNMHYHIYIYIYSSCFRIGIDPQDMLRMRKASILPPSPVRKPTMPLLAWPAWGRAGSNSPGYAQELGQEQLMDTGARRQRRGMAPSNSRHAKCQPSSGNFPHTRRGVGRQPRN